MGKLTAVSLLMLVAESLRTCFEALSLEDESQA